MPIRTTMTRILRRLTERHLLTTDTPSLYPIGSRHNLTRAGHLAQWEVTANDHISLNYRPRLQPDRIIDTKWYSIKGRKVKP